MPISTQRLAQKDPSRKPRVGPNIPEDLTRPATEGSNTGEWRACWADVDTCSSEKRRGEGEGKEEGEGD